MIQPLFLYYRLHQSGPPAGTDTGFRKKREGGAPGRYFITNNYVLVMKDPSGPLALNKSPFIKRNWMHTDYN